LNIEQGALSTDTGTMNVVVGNVSSASGQQNDFSNGDPVELQRPDLEGVKFEQGAESLEERFKFRYAGAGHQRQQRQRREYHRIHPDDRQPEPRHDPAGIASVSSRLHATVTLPAQAGQGRWTWRTVMPGSPGTSACG